MRDIDVSGIQHVTAAQVREWRESGLVPRLVGMLKTTETGYKATVGVRTYANDDPFAHIAGKTKALRVTTDAMGEIVTMGGGAEPMATASAALKDLELLLARPRR